MARDGWDKVRVSDLVERGVLSVDDGYRVRNEELGPIGIPFVRGGDIGDGSITTKVRDHIRPEYTDRVQKKLAQPLDVAFISKGTVGRVGLLRAGQPKVVFAPQVCYWRALDSKQLNSRFLYYLLTSHEFQANLDAVKTHGSMVADYVSLSDQRGFSLTVPPIEVQDAIANILGVLDDKIELNRRMNETLEGLARAIFQSWFVDFDPVRAQRDGLPPPALSPTTAALFPDSFEDSELGKIPKGWRTIRWGEIATLEYGKSLRDYQAGVGRYVVFGTNGRIGRHDEPLCHSEGIIIGRKGAYRGVHFSPEPFFVIDTAFYLKPKADLDLKWAYFELLNFDINNMDSGSAIPSTSRDDFYSIPVNFPPLAIQRDFGRIVTALFAKKFANDRESSRLAAIRDALLPKLLSGELRVAEAERLVEDAT